jgi:hypothetical protein
LIDGISMAWRDMGVFAPSPARNREGNARSALLSMDKNGLAFLMTLIGTVCWGVCFWWMYRISEKQNSLLAQLSEQNKRIEKMSRVEHDLIKEVHPQVGEIKEGMEEMIAAVKENTETTIAAIKENAESGPGPMKSERG